MAVVALTYVADRVGYDYATGRYDALTLDTLPASIAPQPATGATITPA